VANSLSGVIVMQYCETCGAELPNNALFCGSCGKKTISEDENVTNVNTTPIEDISEPPSAISMALNDSQDSTSENGEQEKQQTPDLSPQHNAEEEEQTSYVTSENEEEEQTQQDYIEPTSSMPVGTNPEPEIQGNQFPDEQLQYSQTPIAPLETQRPYASSQKSRSRPVSRCLLFSLAGLIVVVGVVVSLMGVLRLNILGFSGSSNAQSSSSSNEIINPNGSSLTASICVNTSTPSTSVTNQGSTFELISSSGCSTLTASRVNSSCLIFPNTTGASRKYIFDVSNAAIDSKSYHLVLGVVDYTAPTTYNDARHISIGLSEGSMGRNFSWLYRSGSIIINNDEQSGTMDVILVAVDGGNTLHIVGNWACGRQMKST
jgi:hypothetical protein